MGYYTVAPDLRGRNPGARPMDVKSYVIGEFMADILAIADDLKGRGHPFHLMGTSIGSMIAWHLAAEYPRVLSLAINIPHPAAFQDVALGEHREEQQAKMEYTAVSRAEGNERAVFEATLDRMALPRNETDHYRTVFADDDALTAAFHWYRAAAIDPRNSQRLSPVLAPTLFLWPFGAGNVSKATAEANANQVIGPYRLEILERAQNYALQGEPVRVTRLLVEHLKAHGNVD